MKNKLFNTIFFLTIFLGTLLISQSSSYADVCHTTAEGKVIVENADGSGTATKDLTGSLSTDGGDNFDKDQCLVSPLFYRLEGYEIRLCTSDPYVSGDTPLLERCTAKIVSRPDNNPKIIEIPLGEEVDMLDGEDLLIPVGTYTHAVLIGGNHLAVKHNIEFVREEDNDEGFSMDGLNTAAAGPKSGVKCWTVKDAASTFNNLAGSSHTSAAGTPRTYTSPTPGEEETLGLTCGAAIVTTVDNVQEYGYQFEIIDSMGGSGVFVAHEDYSTDEYASGTTKAFVLLQSSGAIATTRANAVKIAYIAKLPALMRISDQTIGFKILIATNATVSLDTHGSGTNDTLEAKKMGVEPFGVKFQTRNRRSRGAWR
jgi:hypothetical protein